jgi:hypothetical protein
MKTLKTGQQGFFAVGIGLALAALFGGTTAVIVTHEENKKEELATMQRMSSSQWLGTSLADAAGAQCDSQLEECAGYTDSINQIRAAQSF